MRRYTVHYRFGQDYLPMANYNDMNGVGRFLLQDNEEEIGYKVFDNIKKDWVETEKIFLACILSKEDPDSKNNKSLHVIN